MSVLKPIFTTKVTKKVFDQKYSVIVLLEQKGGHSEKGGHSVNVHRIHGRYTLENR